MPPKFLSRTTALIAITLLCASPASAQSTGSIVGTVSTPDGEPVVDGIVTLDATTTPIRTDDDGRFRLEGVPEGRHLLQIDSLRHGRGLARVTVVAGQSIEVGILLEQRVHSEAIVVTAAPGGRGSLDLAVPVTVLDDQALSQKLESTLGETLAGEPGISSTYFAPGASRPVIRGLAGDRVKVMENGLGTGDASSTSPDHAVGADPLATERIEVIRGPATLLYGSNAIGGAVNLIDERVPSQRSATSLHGKVDLRIGTAADERSTAAAVGGGGGDFAWRADALLRDTDDAEIPGRASVDAEDGDPVGVLPNSDQRSTGGGLGGSWFFGDKGFVGVAIRSLDAEYGIPGGHHHGEEGLSDEHEEDEHEEEELRIDLEQRRLDLRGATNAFGAFEGASFRVGVTDYEHRELEGPGEIGTRFFTDSVEARIEAVQRQRGNHSGSVGLQVTRVDLEAIGDEAFLPPVETTDLGLFTFQEWTRGRLAWQAGARYENREIEARTPEGGRSLDGFSGSLGLVFRPQPGYSLGASLARSVKLPNAQELFTSGLHVATSSFEIGDPALTEETSLGLDLTFRKTEGRVTGSVSLFRNEFDDFIFQEFTGEEIDGFPVVRAAQADATFEGAEILASIELASDDHSSWDLDLSWDVVRAERVGGVPLPRIPPQRFGLGLHHRGDHFHGGADVRWVQSQDRTAPEETRTAGYTLVDAVLGYRWFLERSLFDVDVKVTNLTDEEARSHASFVKDDVPLPGRNISLAMRLTF